MDALSWSGPILRPDRRRNVQETVKQPHVVMPPTTTPRNLAAYYKAALRSMGCNQSLTISRCFTPRRHAFGIAATVKISPPFW